MSEIGSFDSLLDDARARRKGSEWHKSARKGVRRLDKVGRHVKNPPQTWHQWGATVAANTMTFGLAAIALAYALIVPSA
jgi:hypothetical protein